VSRGVSQQAKPSTRKLKAQQLKAPRKRAPERREGGDSDDLKRTNELAALIETASDAVVGVSNAGVITRWGAGAARFFGYSSGEALGQRVAMLAPPHRSTEAIELLAKLQSGQQVDRIETERVTKDGVVKRVLLSVTAIWGRDGKLAGSIGVFRDLSEQRDAEAALQASERRYHSVVEALSEGVVMQDSTGQIITCNESAELILGLRAEQLVEGTAEGNPAGLVLLREDGSVFPREEHPSMVSMRTGRPQRDVVMGVESADGPTRWISINASPLIRHDEETPYAAVTSFTDITELRSTLAELHEARFEDLRRLAIVAEYRDDDTNKHTERVARTAELLANELGLDGDMTWTINRAAPLHDVGKIGIPDAILLKPGQLTVEEFEVIKTHTVIGGRILCESRFPVVKMAMEIAFTHHERWDGSGYPSGLVGEQIPIAGRIVAVADAFDAMTHARPYKGALEIAHAVAEIERCRGSQFDPRVVDAFMKLDHEELVDRNAAE
jgi:putative two-component system response regulator